MGISYLTNPSRQSEGKNRRDRPQYPAYQEGEWIAPKRHGYQLGCCDCGLVHRVNFRLVKYGRGLTIIFQAFRDNKATSTLRGKLNAKQAAD
jgi:hypothetical protein